MGAAHSSPNINATTADQASQDSVCTANEPSEHHSSMQSEDSPSTQDAGGQPQGDTTVLLEELAKEALAEHSHTHEAATHSTEPAGEPEKEAPRLEYEVHCPYCEAVNEYEYWCCDPVMPSACEIGEGKRG